MSCFAAVARNIPLNTSRWIFLFVNIAAKACVYFSTNVSVEANGLKCPLSKAPAPGSGCWSNGQKPRRPIRLLLYSIKAEMKACAATFPHLALGKCQMSLKVGMFSRSLNPVLRRSNVGRQSKRVQQRIMGVPNAHLFLFFVLFASGRVSSRPKNRRLQMFTVRIRQSGA